MAKITEYSTSEIAIGKWTDGKTIYRKCYHITNTTNGVDVTVDSALNKSTVIALRMYGASYVDGYQQFPIGQNGTNYGTVKVDAGGLIYSQGWTAGVNANIIFEYMYR